MRGRERGRESGGYSRFHQGQPWRRSLSPEVRYYGGARVPSRVPPYGGDRGVWADGRPRRRKAFEQVDNRRDRFREEQRYGGQRFRGRSRVLSREGHVIQYHRHGKDSATHHRHKSPMVKRSFSRTLQQRRHESVDPSVRVLVHRRLSIRPERGMLVQQQAEVLEVRPQKGSPPSSSQQKHEQHTMSVAQNGTNSNHFVTFYFTNVLDDISYSSLRQDFEVCGIMEDIYLAKKRNVNGAIFGFVRYSKVKDIDKLLKAVNNIWFGDYKVVAKVTAYDRYGNKRGEGRERGEGEKFKEGEKSKDEEGEFFRGGRGNMGRVFLEKGVAWGVGGGGSNKVEGAGTVYGAKPVVKERDVVEGRKTEVGAKVSRQGVFSNQVYVPKYSSSANDLSWATKGMVASVLNREVIPVLQRRILDAGFDNLVLFPLGADKVLLRTLDDSKRSFDFARMLLSTSSLEIINSEAQIVVDGVLFDLKIIEEWGLTLGEDACLFDEEDLDDVLSEMPDVHDDVNGCGDVDALVNHITENLNEDVGTHQQRYPSPVVLEPSLVSKDTSMSSASLKPQGMKPSLLSPLVDPKPVIGKVHAKDDLSNKDVSESGSKGRKNFFAKKKVLKRTSSCPPLRVRCSDSEKKGSGHLRHCAQNLKRIARLSDKDRKEVLRALRRTMKQRRTVSAVLKAKVKSTEANSESQSSVNNDWKH
ncbi:RNA recognition motif [Medicago truncatula]|uniref:RNA recognition motif n=1 Tax=Medicago truncatula TaxID=3880 RepID=A0A072VKI0_MEDTR|nr:RNA recognition motif [Medicago truncatula]